MTLPDTAAADTAAAADVETVVAAFLAQVVRFAADRERIAQFVDVGSAPGGQAVRDIITAVAPHSVVVTCPAGALMDLDPIDFSLPVAVLALHTRAPGGDCVERVRLLCGRLVPHSLLVATVIPAPGEDPQRPVSLMPLFDGLELLGVQDRTVTTETVSVVDWRRFPGSGAAPAVSPRARRLRGGVGHLRPAAGPGG